MTQAVQNDTEAPAPTKPLTAKEIDENIQKRMLTGPIWASQLWDVKVDRAFPRIIPIEGDHRCIFYRNKFNVIAAEAGKGKTWFLLKACALDAIKGIPSLFMDFEKSYQDFIVRLKDLGVTREQARYIAYWSPMMGMSSLTAMIQEYRKKYSLDIVAVDSVSRAMVADELDEDKNFQVRQWYNESIGPILKAGGTLIVADHLKKPEESGGRPIQSQGRSPKGGIGKLEMTTGVMVMLQTAKAFSVNQSGSVIGVCTKDNNGQWQEGEHMFEMVVDVDNGLDISFVKPADQGMDGATGEHYHRPTHLMEKVCRLVEMNGRQMTVAAIKKEMSTSPKWVMNAIEALDREGYVKAPPVMVGETRSVASIRSYTEKADPQRIRAQQTSKPAPLGTPEAARAWNGARI